MRAGHLTAGRFHIEQGVGRGDVRHDGPVPSRQHEQPANDRHGEDDGQLEQCVPATGA
jgi:hypothetical protein